MEISGKMPSVHQATQSQPPRTKANVTPAVRPAPKGDRVQLSAQAREMQAAKQAIQQIPDVDLDKVANIKAQLKEGRYQADAQKIASRMIMESLLNDPEQ